ncbi:polysaccharide deacetylase family protein [soil metagenome]
MILMYHYIGEPPPSELDHRALYVLPKEFEHQLLQLKRMGIRSVSPAEYEAALDAGELRGIVWITFDDGHLDNYAEAFPLLKKHGFTATFFVIAARMMESTPGFATAAQLREMAGSGMTIGSHSLTHPRLAKIPREEMRREVSKSRASLEGAVGHPVTAFCYPYGNWDPGVVRAVEEAGYSLAVSTIRDNRNALAQRYYLNRAMVQPGRVGWRFRYLFSPLYHFIHASKNRRRWKHAQQDNGA